MSRYAQPADTEPRLDRDRDSLALALRELSDRYSTGTGVDEVALQAMFPAGKLIRPLLTLQCCRAAGGNPEGALRAALAVEALHAATLVHDDIIDHDVLRRGRPTVGATHGTAGALLVGDLLIFRAVEALSDLPFGSARTLACVRLLSRCGRQLCVGEFAEQQVGLGPHALSAYLDVVRGKTGSLLATAAAIGAILGGADGEVTKDVGRFGTLVGVAFQMRDDLLPYTRNALAAGKDRDSDVREGRATLPLIEAWRRAGSADRRALEWALYGAAPVPERQARADRLVERYDAVRAGRRMLHHLSQLAIERLPTGAAWEPLGDFARALADSSA